MEFGYDIGQNWGDYHGINNEGWNPPADVYSYGDNYDNGGASSGWTSGGGDYGNSNGYDAGGGYDGGGGGDYGGGGD